MPAYIPDAPRTPAGRVSRKFVPVLRVQDRAAIEQRGRDDSLESLSYIDDDIDRLYRASSLAEELLERLKPLRLERNRLAVILWAFHSARGKNFHEAVGVKGTYLNRVKMEMLGVKSIPMHPGTTRSVDVDMVRDLALRRGLAPQEDAADKLAEVVNEIIYLEACLDAAREVRDQTGVRMVVEGRMSKSQVGDKMRRTHHQVGQMVKQALGEQNEKVSA